MASGGVELGAPDEDPREQLHRLLDDDPADLYENAPCGYLSTLPDGSIVKVNRTFCAWTGRTSEDLLDVRFQDLLAPGGRIFTETHLMPLLRPQQQCARSRNRCSIRVLEVRQFIEFGVRREVRPKPAKEQVREVAESRSQLVLRRRRSIVARTDEHLLHSEPC